MAELPPTKRFRQWEDCASANKKPSMDYLAHATVLLQESARLIDGTRFPYVRIFEALTAVGIASVEQQIELNAKVERALQMGNRIMSSDYGGAIAPCPRCGSLDWPHVCQPKPPDDALPPGLCPICPRCDLPGEKCICDTVPGQP